MQGQLVLKLARVASVFQLGSNKKFFLGLLEGCGSRARPYPMRRPLP